MPSIPHTSEDFRAPSMDVIAPDAYRSWVGPAPRLAYPDGSTAYAQIQAGSPTFFYVAARLIPFTLSTAATVKIQARTRGGTAGEYDVEVLLYDVGDSADPVYAYPALTVSDEWQIVESSFTFAEIAHLAPFAAAGELVVATIGVGGMAIDGFDLSWVDFITAGLRPLQHRQRTDAYGVGGAQAARTRTTFQSGQGARYPV